MPAPAVAAAATVAKSKTGRRLLLAGLAAVVAIPLGFVMALVLAFTLLFGTGNTATAADTFGASCVPNVQLVAKVQGVTLYSTTQLTNAAAIMQAAAQLGLSRDAQILGVQAALQESGLTVLDYGDTAGPDSRGLFQQRAPWGPLSVRMDPTGSATLFFQALMKVTGWQTMAPEDAIHTVQDNQRASDYAPKRADAEKIVAAWADASCTANVPARAVDAAAQLVAAYGAGTVHPQRPIMWAQISAYTRLPGPTPNCLVDVRVMQLLLLAKQWYGEVGFSDLGRLCVGDCSYGAGTNSMHCQSPDLAVDFTSLGGHGLDGADPASVDFVRRLASVLPTGAGIGQADCRARGGVTVKTPGIRQFTDACTHLHVEVPKSGAPLNITPTTSG